MSDEEDERTQIIAGFAEKEIRNFLSVGGVVPTEAHERRARRIDYRTPADREIVWSALLTERMVRELSEPEKTMDGQQRRQRKAGAA